MSNFNDQMANVRKQRQREGELWASFVISIISAIILALLVAGITILCDASGNAVIGSTLITGASSFVLVFFLSAHFFWEK